MRLGTKAVGLAAAAATVAVCWSAGSAQVKRGKTRLAETKHLMRGSIGPDFHGLGDALKGEGPQDDKAWDQMVTRGSMLNEMGWAMMDDGRCPDGVWAGSSNAMRDASAAMVEAAKSRNMAGAQAALKDLGASCKSCHVAHKK